MTYTLVPFVPAHLPELTDLWIESWIAAMPDIDFEARRVWFVDHLTALRDRGAEVTCAFDGRTGTMAGFITMDRASGHIDQLAVAPAYWGEAAATALLQYIKRPAAHLHLDVNQDNPRAVRFYEREGFRRTAAGINPNSGRKTWRFEWAAR